MANTKHSVAREIIIDRLLHKRRGYSVPEMLELVNEALEFEGFSPVTLSTIRRDINTFRYRYRQRLYSEKRGHQIYFKYEDPNYTMFTNVLTFGEIQHIRSALMCIRARDEIRGSLMYQQLTKRLADILDIDSAYEPVVIYEKIPPLNEMKRFKALYEHVLSKTPAIITTRDDQNSPETDHIIHPYYLSQKGCEWYLLCHDSTNDKSAEIPLKSIVRMSTAREIKFIPNKDFPLNDYYKKNFKYA